MPIILTCDVEDWLQAYTQSGPVTSRCVDNIKKVVDFLSEIGVKATFFVQGMVAEQYPEAVRILHRESHDIQTHGYSHAALNRLSAAELRKELMVGKDVIEQIIGQEVTGFRAPAFSIADGNSWIFDLLLECGFSFDSSIFPIRMRRYGIAGYPKHPHIIQRQSGKIAEFPICVIQRGMLNMPLGGGYLRLFPIALIQYFLSAMDTMRNTYVLYFHPYEFSPHDFSGWEQIVPLRVRILQKIGRKQVCDKLRKILRGKSCSTMAAETRRIFI